MAGLDDIFAEADAELAAPVVATSSAHPFDSLFQEADAEMGAESSPLGRLFKGVKESPMTVFQSVKDIPSGLENVGASVFSPIESMQSGRTEKTVRGIGKLASGTAGALSGGAAGASLGLLGGPLAPFTVPAGGIIGGAIGGAAGLLGFDWLNQATGSDEKTPLREDALNLMENTGQGIGAGTLTKAAGSALRVAPKIADVLDRKSLGVGKNDLKQSLKYKGVAQDASGEASTSLSEAIKTAGDEGAFGKFNLTRDPLKLYNKNQQVLGATEDALQDVLSVTDQFNPTVVIPKYTISESWIKTQPVAEQPYLLQALDEIKAAHNQSLPGTLEGLQLEKRALYEKTYGESGAAKEALSKYVAADLKNAIENTVDDLSTAGVVPQEFAGQVKALNQKSGTYQQVKPLLERKLVAEQLKDPISRIVNSIYTTGGIGVPTLAGTMLGGPVGTAIGLGVGAIGKAAQTPFGQALAARLFNSAGKLSGKGLGSLTISGAEGQDENKSNSMFPPDSFSANDNKKKQDTESFFNPTSIEAPMAPEEKKPSLKQNIVSDLDVSPKVKKLMVNLVSTESSGNPNAIGPETRYGTAKGLGQLLDSTGEEWHRKLGLSGEYDPFNQEQNLTISAHYLDWLMGRFHNDEKLALAAYNYGIGNVKNLQSRYGKSFRDIEDHLPDETSNYVKKITDYEEA